MFNGHIRANYKMWPRYLIWFAHEHVDFRHAEMESITSLLKIPMKFIEPPCVSRPFWIVDLPSEECAKQIASRSVLVKSCIELWSQAKTESRLHDNLRKSLKNTTGQWIVPENSDMPSDNISERYVCPSELIEQCSTAEKSFKIEVETFCKHFSLKEKVNKIESFSYLPFEGPVKLKNPDVRLMYLEFYGIDPNNVPEKPYDLFFGKWVADGQRDLIQVHSLKKRQFIGNTSLDAQLAIIMANQAQVRIGDILLDPFVGSGSLFVAAAHFGGYVWGSDIDYMMLHAKTRPTRVGQKVRTKEENIRSNMRNYGTESRYLDVVVSDFSLPLWRDNMRFDAIITDPPYGVREPTERIGIERENYALTEEHLLEHVPAKVGYALPHIFKDLCNFAAHHLDIGRRLVCWYPLVREEYKESHIPSHPCLKLISNSEQVLSKITSRRLLTYEKIAEPDSDTTMDPCIGLENFREKYFSYVDTTRRERKEKKAEEIAAYLAAKAARENNT